MIKWKKMILLALLSAVLSVIAIMPATAKPAGPGNVPDKKEEQTRAEKEEESEEPKHRFVKVLDALEEQGLLYSLEETVTKENMEAAPEAETEVDAGDAGAVIVEAEAGNGDAGIVSEETETENGAGAAGAVSAGAEDGSEAAAEDTSAIADAKEALFGFGLEESAGESMPAEDGGIAEDSVPAEIAEPAVVDQAGEADEGTISVPDHPIAQTAEKMVFIGDSRTVDMMNAVHDGSVWACKVSMGYQWMATVGVPAVDGYIDAGTAVIILMGVNDPYNISNYIGYTNEKAAEWAARGATTYFVSVGPVDGDPYVTNAEIESFNAALQANLSGVYYIDIYSYLMANGFSTVDGTHYPDNVSIAIYNYIVEHLEVNRTGIWG